MSCAAPNVQHSSCATENCRYDVFNGHKMLTCRHESFTASPFQTLASTSAQKTSLVQSTSEAVRGIWSPSQQLHDLVMLLRYCGPYCSCTPERTKHNRLTQCQQRRTASKYVRHVSNGWTAVARPPRGFYQTSTAAAQRLTPTMVY